MKILVSVSQTFLKETTFGWVSFSRILASSLTFCIHSSPIFFLIITLRGSQIANASRHACSPGTNITFTASSCIVVVSIAWITFPKAPCPSTFTGVKRLENLKNGSSPESSEDIRDEDILAQFSSQPVCYDYNIRFRRADFLFLPVRAAASQ